MDTHSSSLSYTDSKCLIAGVIDKNVPTPQKLESDLRTAWRLRGKFWIVAHDNNLFKIQYECKHDHQYIFENRPWVVNKLFIAIQSCKQNSILADEKIYRSLIWVQFGGLPMEHHNPMVATRLGNIVGDANMFPDYQVIPKNSTSFLRVRAEVDITLPLIQKIKHVMDNKDYGWIQCTYERVRRHCKDCGRVGHVTRDCKWKSNAKISEAENNLKNEIRRKLHGDIEFRTKDETRRGTQHNATKHTALIQWDGAKDKYDVFNDSPSSYGENISDNTGSTASTVYLQQGQSFPRASEPRMEGMQSPFEVGGPLNQSGMQLTSTVTQIDRTRNLLTVTYGPQLVDPFAADNNQQVHGAPSGFMSEADYEVSRLHNLFPTSIMEEILNQQEDPYSQLN